MKLIRFDDYLDEQSGDVLNYYNKVGIATSESISIPYFKEIRSDFDISDNLDIPIIKTSSFKGKSSNVSEAFEYNSVSVPSYVDLIDKTKDSKYTPNSVSDIKKVKSLKFPIEAVRKNDKFTFKTIGKLKSSESIFSMFTEKPVGVTKFSILAFKDKPISIVEHIRKFDVDVDYNYFDFKKESNDLSKLVFESFNNLDVYNIHFIVNKSNKVILTGIDTDLKLNPHQGKALYEAVYSHFNGNRLPNWVRNTIAKDSTTPYYKQMAHDTKLVKSKHSINYEKYK